MTKLESLKERPATMEDIGKSIYSKTCRRAEIVFDDNFSEGDKIRIKYTEPSNPQLFDDMNDTYSVSVLYADNFYWSKPVVISEAEYQDLKAHNEFHKGVECYQDIENIREEIKNKDEAYQELGLINRNQREESKKLKELVDISREIIKRNCTQTCSIFGNSGCKECDTYKHVSNLSDYKAVKGEL